MLKPIRLLLASGAVTAALLTATQPAQASLVRFSSGHIDLVDIAYEAGELELGVHDEDNDVEYATDEVKIVVKQQAEVTVPNDPAFDFLGTPGVSTVWILPQIQDTDLVWPGVATEEVEAGLFTDDELTLAMQSVSGPGELALYVENAVGQPNVLVDSGDGLPDTIALNAGDHQHYNWAFDRAGTYCVTFSATGTLADTGEQISSEAVTLRVVVQG
ncbi:choice-of-anchor M domain-containing protein [Salinispora fenicalii]|uniref:choice-of-anchor M domain-containing protein n=1 Tax=Salinispora fenicalii TaxID=1137263 RepID=UPI000480CA9C|nr:choice-of-anchor M domain-containing protein [Salinispora fenicalii]